MSSRHQISCSCIECQADGSYFLKSMPEIVPPSKQWLAFASFCAKLGHGRIEKLEIQNGVPVFAETVTEKVKF
jgi:hypothetical protein